MNMMEYKGFNGTVEYSAKDNCLFGKIAFIRDLVSYEGDNMPLLEKHFKAAVDDYVETCKQLGKEPNKPFKGMFNVHITPELHRDAVIYAQEKSLNAFVMEAIQEKVNRIKNA
jgi:predicted HicB family RNase H-like nuclease